MRDDSVSPAPCAAVRRLLRHRRRCPSCSSPPNPTRRTIVSVSMLIIALGIASSAGMREPARVPAREPTSNVRSDFDYFLIALSWSPMYCEANPHDREQCGRRGYGFVLHGLWPQYERGGGPQQCATRDTPDRKTIADAMAFMPSRRLIEHEWRAHGSCTGLGAKAYFDLADRAYAALRVPPELVAGTHASRMTADDIGTAFVRANPGLRSDMFGVICRGADLAEVRVCVDTTLDFRECGRGVRTRCPRDATLRIPSVR